jgi:hypothetical protein
MSDRLDNLIRTSEELAARAKEAREESRRLIERSRTLWHGSNGRLALPPVASHNPAAGRLGQLPGEHDGNVPPRPSDVELAEAHVEQAEKRVARQEQLVSEMERDKHAGAAERARTVLATFSANLKVLRAHMAELRRKATAARP